MKDELFEKLDESFMEKFKALRGKKLPSEAFKGFSDSVLSEIQKRNQEKTQERTPFKSWIPIFVPVLGVLLVFVSLAIFRPHHGFQIPNTSVLTSQIALSTVSEISDISDEIAALRELGEWTDEDEQAL